MSMISVVLATYNGEKFIIEQLDTLYGQTRLPDEVIIGDDCSSDKTVEIIKEYIQKHELEKTVRIIENYKNKGYARNFIDLSMEAKGDYIFFCDQDDIWDKDKIKSMCMILEGNNDIKLLCSNLEPFYDGEGGRKWDQKDLDAMTNDGSVERPEMDYFNFFCQRSGCTMCVRRDFLHQIAPYWVQEWAHDDFVWKMSIVTNNCFIYQYCSLKRRMHDNNASSMKIRTRAWRISQIRNQLKQYESFDNYYKKMNEDDSKKKIIDRNVRCAKRRLLLLEKRNPLMWLSLLLKYRNCYPRKQALLLDLYLVFFPEYKGVN